MSEIIFRSKVLKLLATRVRSIVTVHNLRNSMSVKYMLHVSDNTCSRHAGMQRHLWIV